MEGMNKLQQFDARLAELGVRPEDLDEGFTRSRGPGGQHVNCSATAVQLRHAPSGIEVRAEGERSQMANRVAARQRLIARLEEAREAEARARVAAREKRRRQNRRPSRAARRRNVERKRRRAAVKRNRGRVRNDD